MKEQRVYRGCVIRVFDSMGANRGFFYEAWKDGRLLGFAYDEVGIEMLIESIG